MATVKYKISRRSRRALRSAATAWSAEKLEAIKKVNARYADLVFREAVRRAPVDTGNLRSTIEQIVENAGYRILVGTRKTTYALFVELGTSRTAAQPFLRPAFEKYAAEWLRDIRAAIRK